MKTWIWIFLAVSVVGTVVLVWPKLQPTPSPDPHLHEVLHSVIIPEVEFENTPIWAALEFLEYKSRELDNTESDPALKGISWQFTAPDPVHPAFRSDTLVIDDSQFFPEKTFTYKGSNVRLIDFLREACDQTGFDYEISDRIYIIPK